MNLYSGKNTPPIKRIGLNTFVLPPKRSNMCANHYKVLLRSGCMLISRKLYCRICEFIVPKRFSILRAITGIAFFPTLHPNIFDTILCRSIDIIFFRPGTQTSSITMSWSKAGTGLYCLLNNASMDKQGKCSVCFRRFWEKRCFV